MQEAVQAIQAIGGLALTSLLAQAAAANPLQLPLPQVSAAVEPQPQTPGSAAVISTIHAFYSYWKSKVYNIHSKWKDVTDCIDPKDLEKSNLSADKMFEGHKMEKFPLGSRVKIVGENKHVFKQLHKKVGIWKETLYGVIGKEAIVTTLASGFTFGLILIESGVTEAIHGFALQKVEESDKEGIWMNNTDFKPGDEVVIGVDDSVLSHLQHESRKTPIQIAIQLKTMIGRVVTVFSGEVVVTFDEMNTEYIHPAALKRYDGKSRTGHKIYSTVGKKSTDIKIGDYVTVIESFSKILQLQRRHGEWNFNMSKFLGKIGIVEEVVYGGDLRVRFNAFESYVLNPAAVKKGTNAERSEVPVQSLHRFRHGDMVKLRIPTSDLQSYLQLLRIPKSFLSIIGGCMKFIGYQDNLRGVIDFGDGISFFIGLQLLDDVEPSISKKNKELLKCDERIGVGKEAIPFTGPKEFAQVVLEKPTCGFAMALESTGKVIGFEKNGNAVLKYSNGRMYSIPDELICSPRQSWINSKDTCSTVETTKKIITIPGQISQKESMILCCITKALRKSDTTKDVNWTFTITEQSTGLRTINIDVAIEIKKFDEFKDFLKEKLEKENFECTSENRMIQVQISGMVYRIIVNQASQPAETEEFPESTGEALRQHETVHLPTTSAQSFEQRPLASSTSTPVTESPAAPSSAVPFVTQSATIPIPVGVTHVTLVLDGSHRGQRQVNSPTVQQRAYSTVSPASVIVNVSGDGNHQLNINHSAVRTVNANVTTETQEEQPIVP